jgi:hypothetical protein
MFSLPGEWQFSRYSLADFRKVFETISVMAYIRSIAQTIAITRECVDMGFADSIYSGFCNYLITYTPSISTQPPNPLIRGIWKPR